MVIEKEINGEVKIKKIFDKDLSYFLSRGWKKSDKKDIPAPNKKGRKRSFIESEVEEE